MPVLDVHVDSLATSTELSSWSVEGFIKPLDVISVLNARKISFMLVGLYGMGGWIRKPRATEDVDVLVPFREYRKAVNRLMNAFPQLEPDKLPFRARLRPPKSRRPVIDVKAPSETLYRHALKNSRLVRFSGQRFRIPTLEMALAMRFAVIVRPDRPWEEKYQAAHDFIRMANSNPLINMKKLGVLGDLLDPKQGKELVEKVWQVRAGQKFTL